MKRVLIDRTHPEDEGLNIPVRGESYYEYEFTVREIDVEPDAYFDGPAGIKQESYYHYVQDDVWDLERWGRDLVVFRVRITATNAQKLFEELPYEQRASILQFATDTNVLPEQFKLQAEFVQCDCIKWAMLRTVLNLLKCDSIWWLHE